MAKTPIRKKRTPPPASTESLLEKYKDFPGIKVLEHRLENPDLPGSLPIRLKGEPSHLEDPRGKRRHWYVRWISAAEPGRYEQITDVMGYQPVKKSELLNPESMFGLADSKDDLVRRGDKGNEILVKMPLEVYTEIKRRQQAKRDAAMKNARKVKSDLADAAGKSLGDEAGETIHSEFTLDMKRTRTTLGRELEGTDAFEDRA